MDADDASTADMRRPFSDPDADPLALDEETVERLLSGELPPAQAPPEYAGVAALLAATVATPTREELAGQAAALAELRAVTRARAAHGRRAGKPRRRRRVGLAAVVVVGALATGGVAGATGHLPGPVREAARSILVTVGGAAPAAPTPGPSPAPLTRPTGSNGADPGEQASSTTGRTGRGPVTTGPGSAASPDLEGLCQAFLAGNSAEQGNKLDAAAFEALARAAGGQHEVPAYCRSLQSGDSKPKKQPVPPDDPGQGQGSGGLPAGTGGDSQGQGGPPDTPAPNG
jgi:hypothetical protein